MRGIVAPYLAGGVLLAAAIYQLTPQRRLPAPLPLTA